MISDDPDNGLLQAACWACNGVHALHECSHVLDLALVDSKKGDFAEGLEHYNHIACKAAIGRSVYNDAMKPLVKEAIHSSRRAQGYVRAPVPQTHRRVLAHCIWQSMLVSWQGLVCTCMSQSPLDTSLSQVLA